MISFYALRRACVVSISVLALLPCLSQTVYSAAPFPNKPIKIIVTASPGGTTDISARALSDILGKELGQSVIIHSSSCI